MGTFIVKETWTKWRRCIRCVCVTQMGWRLCVIYLQSSDVVANNVQVINVSQSSPDAIAVRIESSRSLLR